jgi:hypothetical protein
VRAAAAFDVLSFGTETLPEEAFAGRQLTSLLDESRGRYGVVQLMGTSIEHDVDWELPAARVDALARVAEGNGSISPAAERNTANLTALGAPLPGIIRL